MAKFVFTIEDTPGGVQYKIDGDGVDVENPTNAAVLAMLISKYIEDELKDDFDADAPSDEE